ncbi:MAG: hypothetical protein QRY71_04530 [Candidatus Rhabdochlamydia sp.]
MPIQYSPNAAGLSWLALTQSIENRAQMEANLLALFSSNMQSMMQESSTQASADIQAGVDNGEQLRAQGISTIAGASASAAVTIGGAIGSTVYAKQADNIALGNNQEQTSGNAQSELSLEEVNPESEHVVLDVDTSSPSPDENQASSSSKKSTNQSLTSQKEEPTNLEASTSKKGPSKDPSDPNPHVDTPDDAQDNRATQNRREQRLSQEDEVQMNSLYRKSKLISDSSASLSQISSSLGSASGQVASANYAMDVGQQNAMKDVSQGLSSLFNNEASQLSAALSSCDNFIQNTSGIISALIQASSSRA